MAVTSSLAEPRKATRSEAHSSHTELVAAEPEDREGRGRRPLKKGEIRR